MSKSLPNNYGNFLKYLLSNVSLVDIYNGVQCPNEISGKINDVSTKNILKNVGGILKADLYTNGEWVQRASIMPDIMDVSIIENSGEKKVVIVEFVDHTTEKAVLSNSDTFSLEQGISICVTKKLLSMNTGNGSSLYNKIVNRGLKVYKKAQIEKIKREKEKAEAKKKWETRAAKKRKKQEERENVVRENLIEIQKEAYLRAIREISGTFDVAVTK